ncbi:GNAT family N-acetyltransferase [Nonomuraea pusilla]|uniref:GNAT family N-acetyltransferase n=1 Tax=Nonomuraea pusilla TaxID=46177 RepID=UPI003320E2CE
MPSLVTAAIAAGALARSAQPTVPAGEGVTLRPWRPDDADALMEAFQDPGIQRWHARRADSVDETSAWIEGWRAAWQAETDAHWAMAATGADRLLGRISLKSFNLVDGTAEVAYWTAPWARGGGVCTRAVLAVAGWALDEAGFHRLELQHSTGNPASCRVTAKAGFEAEGTRRGAALHADGWHDMHLHARVSDGHG